MEKEITKYYEINAKVTHDGLDGSATYHRGKEIGELKLTEEEFQVYFNDVGKQEIAKGCGSDYALTALNDLFTQEEVAKVISANYPEAMDLRVRIVDPVSLGDYISESAIPFDSRPKYGGISRLTPDNGVFEMSIRWNDTTAPF